MQTFNQQVRADATAMLVTMLTINYLCREVKSSMWSARPEFVRDKEVILGWILILSDVHKSDLQWFTKRLADDWLLDTTQSPMPAEYAFKKGKGER